MSRCEYVQEQSVEYSISFLCQVCAVNRSSYYDWLSREDSTRTRENRLLLAEIKSVFEQSRKTYGAIRVTKELRSKGFEINRKRVARLMQQNGLKSVHKRKFKVLTTNSKHKLPIVENRLEQNFSASKPNEKWVSDITYIRTKEGWVYLAVVIDLFSRKVIGYSMEDSMHTKLCSDALRMALVRRYYPKELVHHSDRGSQYASFEYRLILKQNGITPSMSRKGNCYDNSVVESFFHTLKVECVYQNDFCSKKEAKKEVSNYIEQFYNNWRRHSSLDYLNPVEYENKFKLTA